MYILFLIIRRKFKLVSALNLFMKLLLGMYNIKEIINITFYFYYNYYKC